jgi:hypothetical protein
MSITDTPEGRKIWISGDGGDPVSPSSTIYRDDLTPIVIPMLVVSLLIFEVCFYMVLFGD